MSKRGMGTVTRIKERITQRLVNKLVLLFTSIIVLVVGSLTVISYHIVEKESVENSIASTTNNLLLVNQNLEDYVQGMEQLAVPQLQYNEIMNAILDEDQDYSSQMVIDMYLRSMFYSRNDLKAIYLYNVNQHKYHTVSKEAYTISVRQGYNEDIPAQSWYKAAVDSTRNQSFQSLALPDTETGYPVEREDTFMAYHRVLRSISSREPLAVLSFYYKDSGRQDIMKDIPVAEGDHLLLLSPDDVPFYTDDQALYARMRQAGMLDKMSDGQNGQFTWTDGDEEYLVIYNTGEHEGWKLVKPIPYRSIYETATATRNWGYVIGGLFLIIAVILVTLTSNAITRPLDRLSWQMKRFSGGDFEAEAPVKGNDEIAYLSRHFNEMVKRTNDLINERYKMKLAEKNAILKALEAEINPHFLYNALQAISTQALKREMFDMADMVDALAQTLRYSINGKEMVYARDELAHIERYLGLQKARFGSRLQVEYEWEDRLKDLRIPRLSIQTLVENSIKHALESMTGGIRIVIAAEVQGTQALISVSDNGPGMSPGRLKEVRASFAEEWEERESGNIGLKNLNTRLKLLYGEEAALEIRTDTTGTDIKMILPQGGDSHV
ncbi:sensor histidine kinase [Paenibacillus sp. P96]|uniref:Sensor histidine kinase n=1 Tax=Paenibacillus zeirhizosphaerae TaxID=2987519 RepID=A0ABT9FWI8_9BACL|nr:histidine kinase [Paenibacillus sp. P96]MDP4099089.1 sensor histidine kinase [Paenibacillus sp. P96]